MLFAAISPDTAVAAFAFVSLAYLVAVIATFFVTRTLEGRLLILGLFTGLVAVWCGLLGGHDVGVQVRAGPGGDVGQVMLGGDVAGILGRIALVLVLGSIALSVLGRWNFRPTSSNVEEAIRDNSV
jgi:hypothetical protein